jgi:drug/metabolite transporter (DMT)-like permease
MDPAHTIARLLGPVFSVIGIGMLANGVIYHEMAGQFLSVYPLIYFSGILALLAGLAILNAHNAWTRDWRSLITALGWIMTAVGTFRILAPQFVTYVGRAIGPDTGFFAGAGIVLLALGGFITFKGYAA